MKQADVLKEIARIEGELGRLQGELVSLRSRVEGGVSSRRMTMAFGAPSPAETAPTIPPPTPSNAPHTGTRSVSPARVEASSTAMDSLPPPAHSRRSRSTIAPASPREGAESAPRRSSSSDVGRYGIVSEGRTRTGGRTR